MPDITMAATCPTCGARRLSSRHHGAEWLECSGCGCRVKAAPVTVWQSHQDDRPPPDDGEYDQE